MEKGSWSFDNDYARNVANLGVDNSLSSHTDNFRNEFLILSERDTFGIMGDFGTPQKRFSIIFSKANTKFCINLVYNGDNSYLFVNRNKIFKFKFSNRNIIRNKNFTNQFCLESLVNKFSYVEAEEVSLKKKSV